MESQITNRIRLGSESITVVIEWLTVQNAYSSRFYLNRFTVGVESL